MDGVSPRRFQSFRYQRRSVDNCSPRREVMAQNDGTRGGTFHGEIDRCRENQDWTTVCSRMFQRDGKDSPNQACSSWFARHTCSSLATGGANFYPPGVSVCRCHVAFLRRYIFSSGWLCFVSFSSFCFH